MRLWSLHPRHLDAAGLTACWREALLARAVLNGRTRGYRHHPQLDRFRAAPDPRAALRRYLRGLLAEARRRGYAFDAAKAPPTPGGRRLPVRRGQVRHEWARLLRKLRRRDPARYRSARRVRRPSLHPLFRAVPGGLEAWERLPGPRK